jgi:hypothetical protein
MVKRDDMSRRHKRNQKTQHPMNTIKNSLLVAALAVSTLSLIADDAGTGPESRGPRGPRGGGRGVPPVAAAIDTNRDGVLDATEIANSAAALGTLDANKDGTVTREELMPKGGRGPGRPDGAPEGAPEGRPGPGRPPMAGPLDANKDGTLDATEIANAPRVLAALDKDADGTVTREEMRPEGGRGPGRPEGAPEDRPEGGRPEGRPGKSGPGGKPGFRRIPPSE